MAAHDAVVRGLDAPATAAVGVVLGGLAHVGGWPLAEAPGPGVHGICGATAASVATSELGHTGTPRIGKP